MNDKDDKDDKECTEGLIINIVQNDLRLKASISKKVIDAREIAKAQNIVENLAISYYDRAIEDIQSLQTAYADLVDNIEDYQNKLNIIYRITHNMKGQGASFNYHMVTYIGDYLCRFLDRIKSKPTKKILDIIDIHIKSMNAILIFKIKGKSDPKGDEIINALEATLEKYAPDIVEVIHSFRKQAEISENKK